MEKLPAYKKCYNKLKSDIDNNVYPIGSYLPTEDELGKMFSVSRTTVRHAIDLLVKDKRIKVKQGAGTQVINPKERELTSFSKFLNVIDINTLFPDNAALTISGAGLTVFLQTARSPVRWTLMKEQKSSAFKEWFPPMNSLCNSDKLYPY